MLMSLQIVYFCVFGRGLEGNELFVCQTIFKNFVKLMGFTYVS